MRTPARCEDGKTRVFHQHGIKTRDGYVYANKRRVYGSVSPDGVETVFTARGKNAANVQPSTPPAAEPELERAIA